VVLSDCQGQCQDGLSDIVAAVQRAQLGGEALRGETPCRPPQVAPFLVPLSNVTKCLPTSLGAHLSMGRLLSLAHLKSTLLTLTSWLTLVLAALSVSFS
jgi:hypothetical protein